MSTVIANLLMELSSLGITLEAQGNKLRYRPRSAMTVELAARMKAHKADLLAMLVVGPEHAQEYRETGAEREVQRFLSVCIPHADGRGAYDPAYTNTIKALASHPKLV